jgi:hypothetical protein
MHLETRRDITHFLPGVFAEARTEALRASVGSTEASASLLARVGVVGPTRARIT